MPGNPKHSAPDLSEKDVKKTQEGREPWPRNKDVEFEEGQGKSSQSR